MKGRSVLWLLSSALALSIVDPASSQVPVIDRAVLAIDTHRDRISSNIEETDYNRFSVGKSVTCSIYQPGRTGDAASTAAANPEITELVRRIAREEDVNESLFLALVYQESRFNPCARSPAGAIGLAQLMPETARELGVDPYDMEDNLSGGARYLKQQLQRFGGNPKLALAAYNAGPGRVVTYGGIPPFKETQGYVGAITQKWLPAFGGANVAGIPAQYGGDATAFNQMRNSAIRSMATGQAISDGSGNVTSWFQQLGQMPSSAVQDSWDHNSGARNANLEMLNQVIRLGITIADLANSRNALQISGLSGSSHTGSYSQNGGDGDPGAGFCDGRRGVAWNPKEKACVQVRERLADIALMLNAR